MLDVTLLGFGAIGRALLSRVEALGVARIAHVVVRGARVALVQAELGEGVRVHDRVPADCALLVECAGHQALIEHVLPALARGVECAVLSVGALAEPGLPERLAQAARSGATQVHLLGGAVGGIDALAAARLAGLDAVTYVGRKPPLSWLGTPAAAQFDLAALCEPATILQASAREAARLYPKNANVAATVALAGLGLDATQVRLIADPLATDNIHEIEARGAFGEMHIRLRGRPLAENPKTSALTVLSALRFIQNRAAALTI